MFNDSLLAKQGGDFCTIKLLSSLRFSRPVFSPIPQSWKLQMQDWVLMHGRVF